jgi:DNA polymerase-3 subunit epsilon
VDFVAIDVETANADLSSICQIGLVKYENGSLVDEWNVYVDPDDYFDPINISIHGINKDTVKGAPDFLGIVGKLGSYLCDSITVCHTHFDRTAIHRAAQQHGAALPDTIWLDSARVARRTWKEFAWRGYGLSNVCEMLGYEFKHHDALEDAKAAAHVLLAAVAETGVDVEGWLEKVKEPIGWEKQTCALSTTPSAKSESARSQSTNYKSKFFIGKVVFTGALCMLRKEAAKLAEEIGYEVGSKVTNDTTVLVIGSQDVRQLAGHDKSSKHRKAEELIKGGASIKILTEDDFLELAKFSGVLDGGV